MEAEEWELIAQSLNGNDDEFDAALCAEHKISAEELITGLQSVGMSRCPSCELWAWSKQIDEEGRCYGCAE